MLIIIFAFEVLKSCSFAASYAPLLGVSRIVMQYQLIINTNLSQSLLINGSVNDVPF